MAPIGEDSELGLGLGFGGELGKAVENPRLRGRSRKEDVEEPRESLCEVYDDSVGPSGKQGRELSMRITCSSKKKGNSKLEAETLEQVVGKRRIGRVSHWRV